MFRLRKNLPAAPYKVNQFIRSFKIEKELPVKFPIGLRNVSPDVYRRIRKTAHKFELAATLGSEVELTELECKANKLIMNEKMAEYKKGLLDPRKFAPGYHIFQVLPKIKESRLFQIIQKMPKGGALKTHDTSMCSADYLLKLTYKKDLWICTTKKGDVQEAVAFRFAKEKPGLKVTSECNWQSMQEFRKCLGKDQTDKYLRKRFSMFPLGSFTSNTEAWAHFMGIFSLLDGLIKYAPIWGEYYYNALKEFYADGVQYMEVRSLLPQLYCLNGEMLPVRDTVQIYKDQLERFKQEHADFIGAKLIYAPLRDVQPKDVAEYVKTCTLLNKEFPDFLMGFDLVGQENLGLPLVEFVPELLKMPKEINFYFHAGTTKWFGSQVDENLIDAVLLGTKRIGHGYAVTKHPVIMALAKYLNIAIEVCPVSNQVMQMGHDFRNHPAATLISQNVPIVISSGNPSLWNAAPLSHDFYMAFLGIASMNADLRFLKKIIRNSISFSGMSDEEKSVAYAKLKEKWVVWIKNLVETNK